MLSVIGMWSSLLPRLLLPRLYLALSLSLTLIETVYANVVYIVKLCHVVYVVVIIVFIKSSGGDDVFESILGAA